MTKLMSVRALFKKTRAIYQEKFTLAVGLLVIPFLLMALNQLLTRTENYFVLPLAFLIALVAVVGIVWGSTSLLLVLADRSKNLTIEEAYRLGSTKILALVWVSILLAIIICGAFFLFIIPGIILTVWLIFAKVIAVVEDETGLKALVKSREYVRGYFWPVFGRHLALAVALAIIYSVLLALTAGVSALFVGAVSTLVSGLLVALINILILPSAIIYSYLIYENIKEIKGTSIVVDQTKNQGLAYLIVGLAGWALLIVIFVFFLSIIASLLAGLFVGRVIGNLPNASAINSATGTPITPTTQSANLTPEQQQQLQAQIEILTKLRDQLKKQLPANSTSTQ